MGLDMYLSKKIYVGAEYKHRNVTGSINIAVDGKPVAINFNKISEITERAMYWRKANQIHAWFVKNVQGGEDDCGEYNVTIEQLEQLLNDCKKVIENKQVAESVLPTQSGFFFGATSYDDYYMEDIEQTEKELEEVLRDSKDDHNSSFYYSSSW